MKVGARNRIIGKVEEISAWYGVPRIAAELAKATPFLVSRKSVVLECAAINGDGRV